MIAAAYLLPGMHQSSLGLLMLLAGDAFTRSGNHRGCRCSISAPQHSCHSGAWRGPPCSVASCGSGPWIWKSSMRPPDHVLARFRLAGIRLFDILVRGAFLTAFRFDRFAGVFWLEMVLVGVGGYLLRRSLQDHDRRKMFLGYILSSAGGMIYRFSLRTTLAFRPIPKHCISRSRPKCLCLRVSLPSARRGLPDCSEAPRHSARPVG